MFGKERIRELEAENHQLKKQLDTARAALEKVKTKALPPCKSMACASCVHCTYYKGAFGRLTLLGCNKDNDCDSYSPTLARSSEVANLIEAMLQSQVL